MPTRVTDLFPTIAGTSAPIDIEEEGVSVDAAANKINFVGAGVTATDGPEEGEVTVTIPGGGGGGGGTVVDWDMSTDIDTTPVELSADPAPPIPYDAGQVLGTETLSLPTTDTTSRFAGASVVDSGNLPSAQWLLFRATAATGTLLAGQNFISIMGGEPVSDPANAYGVSYRPVEDDLYNPFTAAVIDAAFTLNDWALLIFDPSLPETRVITASVNTVVSTNPINGAAIRALIQSQTSAGTGNLALEISTDPADLGALNPGSATPMGDIFTILPAGASVGDFLNVTVGGTYEGTAYVAGDGAVYLDDTPSDVVNKIEGASKVTSTGKTANIPADYATIPEALAYLRQFVYTSGATGTILIADGHTLTGADYTFISGEELPWLVINTPGNVNMDFTGASVSAIFEIYNSSINGIFGQYTDTSPSPEYRGLFRAGNSRITSLGSIVTPLTLTNAEAGTYMEDVVGIAMNIQERAKPSVTITCRVYKCNFAQFMRIDTDASTFNGGGSDSRLRLRNAYTGGNQITRLAGGKTIIEFDTDDNPSVGSSITFGSVSMTVAPQRPAPASVEFQRSGGTGKINVRATLEDGASAELLLSDRGVFDVNNVNDIFVYMGNDTTLNMDFDTNNIDVSSFVPNAIFSMGRNARVYSTAGVTKTTHYTNAYGVLANGNTIWLQHDIISPDGALIHIGSSSVPFARLVETMSSSADIPLEAMGRTLQVSSSGSAVVATITDILNDSAFTEFYVERAGANDVTLAVSGAGSLTSVSGNLKIADGGRAHVRRISNDTWVASGDLIP